MMLSRFNLSIVICRFFFNGFEMFCIWFYFVFIYSLFLYVSLYYLLYNKFCLYFSSWFCVVCCLHFLFTYFKIYIVFKKFNLGCCSNYSKVLLRTHRFCMMVQKSNCILLTGIAEYGAFESMWCWGNFGPSSAFSSSRRFRQAAFGFRLRSVMASNIHLVLVVMRAEWFREQKKNSPLTCCSSVIITSTAMFSIPNLVCGLSDFRCVLHIRPSSLSASFISRIRILCDKNRSLI